MKKLALLVILAITSCAPARHTRCEELEKLHYDLVHYYRDSPERTEMLRMVDSMWYARCVDVRLLESVLEFKK